MTINDMETVAEATSSLGMVVADADSSELLAKLPLEVKLWDLVLMLRLTTWRATAKVTTDPNEILSDLSSMMLTYVMHHQGNRIAIEGLDE